MQKVVAMLQHFVIINTQLNNTNLKVTFLVNFRLGFFYMKTFIPIITLTVLLTSCHSGDSRNTTANAKLLVPPSHDITITRSHIIENGLTEIENDVTDYIYIGYMGNFSVDSSGNVYVVSGGIDGDQQIFKYGPSGKLKEKIGRKGRGPGEFQMIANIEIRFDILYVYDENLKRISLFSTTDSKLLDTIMLENKILRQINEEGVLKYSSEFYPLSEGAIFVRAEENYVVQLLQGKKTEESGDGKYHYYYLLDKAGQESTDLNFKVLDNKFGQIGPFPMTKYNLPHNLNFGVKINPAGKIYSTPTDSFLIKIEDIYSDEVRTIKLPYANADLDTDKIINHYPESHTLKEISVSYTFPSVWPAINRFLLDDENRLWVSTITSSYDEYEWWIIEDEELIATFRWPGNKLSRGIEEESIKTIKNGKIYTYELDEGAKRTGSIVVYDYSIIIKK